MSEYKIINDSMLNLENYISPNTIDSIVTDPPYELNFMGKGWDNTGIAFQKETWEKCFNVLKPGGYLLAFGGSRTFHRIAVAIEDAGFEIRDCIMWLYGSGFPKSMNIGLAIDKKEGLQGQRGVGGFNVSGLQEQQNRKAKLHIGSTTDGSKQPAYSDYKSDLAKQWAGWGTCLKPAFEPIIVARKPFKGSLVDNVLEYGVGGLNIDDCRVETDDEIKGGTMPDFRDIGKKSKESIGIYKLSFGQISGEVARKEYTPSENGRFPANVILTYDETDFEEVCGGFPINNKPNGSLTKKYNCNNDIYGKLPPRNEFDSYGDSGSASRYFYCAKASKKDRDEGLDEFKENKVNDGRNASIDNAFQRGETLRKNIHPTVKPTTLMQYLVRLVTPKDGIVLDPFMGSGSTGKAAMYENKERNADYNFIGFELNKEYCDIAEARINYVANKDKKCKINIENNIINKKVENINDKQIQQLNLFDFIEEV